VGRRIPVLLALVVLGIAVLVWVSLRSDPTPGAGVTTSPSAGTIAFDQARADLDRLPVRGWDRRGDYVRHRFGKSWSDEVNVEFGHNGCNTRDDVLRRDLSNLVVRPGTCFAQSGTLRDPYRGEVIDFVRGPITSEAVQIDHVVSLSDAWYKGARDWDDQRRRDFANDPRNLLAVAGNANFDKAFRDAAGWLPPNEAFRCEFVARQVEVKSVYGLWVSARERDALRDVLRGC
jgi:hypothetical protein